MPAQVRPTLIGSTVCGLAFIVRREAGKENPMNWDTVEGNWKQVKGAVREQWGKLTDNDLEQIAGKKDQLIGRIQERYGITREAAQHQADQWAKTVQTEEHAGKSQTAHR
jgi:uncharacterized protein YjbJ (UPF0337 family)